jgi:capsid protein
MRRTTQPGSPADDPPIEGWNVVLREASEFAAKMDELGLVSDADPRKVAKSGTAQTADPTDAPTREAETE